MAEMNRIYGEDRKKHVSTDNKVKDEIKQEISTALLDLVVTQQILFLERSSGHRGAVKIDSCILMYLQHSTEHKPNGDVTFFSDNCGGQQENQ